MSKYKEYYLCMNDDGTDAIYQFDEGDDVEGFTRVIEYEAYEAALRTLHDNYCNAKEQRERADFYKNKNDKLKKNLALAIEALGKCLPVVEEAFWDHSSAGYIPGGGYTHGCYSKLPFSWRQTKEFKEWIADVKTLAKLEGEKDE
jgi:hypothetical protein